MIDIAAQLADILQALRRQTRDGEPAPVVHGDIKPSNIMYDPGSGRISLVDWGSSVFAQQDADGHWAGAGGLALLSGDLQQSNARMGDVYFIGPEQLAGVLSSPRFDEQGVAGTLYALASGQGCRFGRKAMPAASLGLPLEFARLLDALLDDDPERRRRAGDYWLAAMPRLKQLVLPELPLFDDKPQLPVWPGSGTRTSTPWCIRHASPFSVSTANEKTYNRLPMPSWSAITNNTSKAWGGDRKGLCGGGRPVGALPGDGWPGHSLARRRRGHRLQPQSL
ncbi:phosphotransferase [Oceanimonas sp. NS1]|nr:phosphotransferase [Oceanimonas sp. NS1]